MIKLGSRIITPHRFSNKGQIKIIYRRIQKIIKQLISNNTRPILYSFNKDRPKQHFKINNV